MRSIEHVLPEKTSEAELLALVARLNADPAVDGILVQLPLPKHISAARVIEAIDPTKDVDGFHPINVGRLSIGADAFVPCTPLGSLMLLRSVRPDLSGLEAVIVGRSNIVGKPMAQLLIGESCTVTVAHSRTRDLPAVCRRADILVAAVGRPEMIRGGWIKPGAIVIDVGINRVPAVGRRQDPARGRRRLRGGGRNGLRNHAGPRRRRADDHRLPSAQHAQGMVRAARPADAEPRWLTRLLPARRKPIVCRYDRLRAPQVGLGDPDPVPDRHDQLLPHPGRSRRAVRPRAAAERDDHAEPQGALQLDEPLWKQYLLYLQGLSRGRLRPSFTSADFSVGQLFAKGLPVSMTLGALALLLAVGLA